MSAKLIALLKPPLARSGTVMVMMAVMPRREIHSGKEYTGASGRRQDRGITTLHVFGTTKWKTAEPLQK
jgi:hypothetical protein